MQEKAELIGRELVAGHPVRSESVLHLLDIQFAVGSFAVVLLIQMLGILLLHVRNNESGLAPLFRMLNLDYGPLLALPVCRSIFKGMVFLDVFFILLITLYDILFPMFDQTLQWLVGLVSEM